MYPFPFLGHLLDMRRNPLAFMADAAAQGDVVPLYLPRLSYLSNSPAAVKHVLVDNHENYRKGPMSRRLKVYLGDGLLTSEGQWWRYQRRLLQPMLQTAYLEHVIPAIQKSARDMIIRWRTYCENATPFNIYSELIRITTSIIGKVVLGIDLLDVADRLSAASQCRIRKCSTPRDVVTSATSLYTNEKQPEATSNHDLQRYNSHADSTT